MTAVRGDAMRHIVTVTVLVASAGMFTGAIAQSAGSTVPTPDRTTTTTTTTVTTPPERERRATCIAYTVHGVLVPADVVPPPNARYVGPFHDGQAIVVTNSVCHEFGNPLPMCAAPTFDQCIAKM